MLRDINCLLSGFFGVVLVLFFLLVACWFKKHRPEGRVE